MENAISLEWKNFSVPLDKLNVILRNLVGPNYDGMVCDADRFFVVFKEEPTQQETDDVIQFWDNANEAQFSPTLKEIISQKINEASAFGRALILDAAVENVEMGITQAGKTREVADYCANVQRYLESGSLYAALNTLEDMVTAGVPQELAPFITEERLNAYITKIEDYLEI